MPKRSIADKDLKPFDLKAEREAKRLTQADAAELLCASQASIARWESDGTLPRIYRKYWQLHWQHNRPPAKKQPIKQPAKLTVVPK